MVGAVWASAKLTPWVGALLIAGATNGYGQEDMAAPSTLEDAVRDGNAAAVKTLIDAGADVNAAMPIPPDREEGLRTIFGGSAEVVGGTPLGVAALMGRLEAAEILLGEGADPNVVTVSGTPVGMAAARGHTGVLKLLVDAGGDSSGRRLSGTAAVMFAPLLLAAKAGHVDAVKLLVESGGYRCLDGSSFTMGDIAYRAALDQLLAKVGDHELTTLMDRAKEACEVR